MKHKLGGTVGVASAIGITAAVIVGASVSTRQLLSASRAVTHTHLVLDRLADVLARQTDAETGQRGFLLTGEPRFLDPYTAALSDTSGDIAAVRSLTVDNPAQQRSLDEVQQLSAAKFAELRRTIDLYKTDGPEAALRVVRTEAGRRIMDDLRAAIARMRDREQVLLVSRTAAANANAIRTLLALAALALAASLLAVRFTRSAPPTVPVPAGPPFGVPARSAWVARYGLAAVAVAVAAVLHVEFARAFGSVPLFITFFPAVVIVAGLAGAGPGLVATALSSLILDYYFLPPFHTFAVTSNGDLLGLTIFAGTTLFISLLGGRLQQARSARAVTRQQELLAVTLVSIGQGVIVTDTAGRVTFLNPVAERLTGWPLADAVDRPHTDVFRLVNESTLEAVEAGVDPAIRTGASATLPGGILLVARDGRRIPVDDNLAPVRGADGAVRGVVVVFRDTSEKRAAETALQENRARHDAALASMTDAVFISDAQGNFVEFNDAFASIHRFASKDQCASRLADYRDILDVFLPDGTVAPLEQWAVPRALRGERVANAEYTMRRKDTGETWAGSYSFGPIRDEDGQVVGAVVVGRDVTELKRTREAIQNSERQFRTMADAIPQLAWTARPDGFIDWYSRRWYEYTGTAPGTMEGWGWEAVHDPQTLSEVMRAWTASIATGQPFEMVFPLRRADGQFRTFLTRCEPSRDADGRVVQWIGTNTDIEDLTRADEARGRLAAIVESSDDAILSKRLDGTILTWNAAAERLFGYPAAEVIGGSIMRLVPPDRMDEERAMLDRLALGERCEHIETVRLCRDGRRIDVSLTISPIKDAAGRVIGASKIARDITERKRAQGAVAAAMLVAEEARAAAEAANRSKDQFIAVLSHELRTPLNPVLATATLLLADPRFDADTREQLQVIARNVEFEVCLIDDLLDVTRIQRGAVELKREPVELAAVLRLVAETCGADAAAKRVAVTVDLPDGPCWVDGDAARLRQVFWNLLKNAVKFTPAGGTIGICGRRDADATVVVTITDDGVGIEPAALGKIFDAFEQADGSVSKTFGGLGLGLTISRAMVELHGGTIAAASAGTGRGATFEVRLPQARAPGRLAPAAPAPGPESPAEAVVPLRILLVEDHVDTARVMSRLLRSKGHRVEHAADVSSALGLLKDDVFDLLLSDLGLPDGSGWEIMRSIRTQGSTLPGIALSGYGQDNDVQTSLAAGYSAHLTKPVNIPLLIDKISQIRAGAKAA
jgi:PAS domain S-box-containing protein